MSQSSGPVARVRTPAAEVTELGPLVGAIAKAVPRPINDQQVAALLETAGVTDAIAVRRYGYADIFALARDVTATVLAMPVETREPDAGIPAPDRKAMLLDYLRGPFSLLPLILLAALMRAYQAFGQWGSRSVLILSASTIGSLLVTSGFVQVMARKGSIYLSQGYYRAARAYLGQILGLTSVVVSIAACGLTLSGTLLGFLMQADQALMVAAFLMLSALWMLSGVLGILKQMHWFGIGLAVGAALSYGALHALTGTGVSPGMLVAAAASIGFIAAVGTMTAVIVSVFRRSPPEPVGVRVVPPPRTHLFVGLAPYFAYGVTYLLVVLAGHVGGWLGRLPVAGVRIEAIAISEMGLTVALTGNMLVGGVPEHTMQRFWQCVRIYQTRAQAAAPADFSESLKRFYTQERRRFLIALGACTSTVALALLAYLSLSTGAFLGMIWTPSATVVVGAGMIGYGLLALGLFDTMLLITLSQPRFALGALLVGLVVTLGASIAMGAAISYEYGAVGTVLGSTALLAVARTHLTHLINHADYYYYASF